MHALADKKNHYHNGIYQAKYMINKKIQVQDKTITFSHRKDPVLLKSADC